MSNKIKSGTAYHILISTILAICVGNLIHFSLAPQSELFKFFVDGIFDLGGQLFMNSLKMLVIPLVFFSLSTGVAGIRDAKALGRIGLQTLCFFLVTTILAITSALLISSQVRFSYSELNPGSAVQMKKIEPHGLTQTLLNLIPANPIKAMAEGETLQVIIFAILLGWAISQNKKVGPSLLITFENLNAIFIDLILLLIKAAPIGVFCLLAKTFSELGLTTLFPLAKYFFTLLIILLLHNYLCYGIILRYLIKVSPILFFKKIVPVQVFAFSTSSSNATLPITLDVTEKSLGVSNRIASFVIPLGATLNMNGTSIMQAVATVFIANVYQIELSLSQYATVVAMGTLAAIGTAGAPGVGIVMLAMVLQQVNLPVEGIGLILGVDRLLDMVRTSVNVTGDAVAALWVAKSQGTNDWNSSVFDTHQ